MRTTRSTQQTCPDYSHVAFIAQLDKDLAVIPSSDEESPVTINDGRDQGLPRGKIPPVSWQGSSSESCKPRSSVREDPAHKLAKLLIRELTYNQVIGLDYSHVAFIAQLDQTHRDADSEGPRAEPSSAEIADPAAIRYLVRRTASLAFLGRYSGAVLARLTVRDLAVGGREPPQDSKRPAR